jgi:transcription antitermination factor NusG
MLFEDAIKELRRGKKIKRKSDLDIVKREGGFLRPDWHLQYCKIDNMIFFVARDIASYLGDDYSLSQVDILANDWEIFEEPKKESKFKVGDRVATYHVEREVGKVIEIDEEDSTIQVTLSEGHHEWFHEKQCRRIKKKC